jgi:hypothetical protein
MKHELNTDGEEFLILDLRILIGSGEKFGAWKHIAGPKAGVPRKTREAISFGKRRYVNRAFTALCGCRVGKFTGCYRIVVRCYRVFPHNSTQVVDFPRLAVVNIFCGQQIITKSRQGNNRQKHAVSGRSWRKRTRRDRAVKNFVCWEGAKVNLLP